MPERESDGEPAPYLAILKRADHPQAHKTPSPVTDRAGHRQFSLQQWHQARLNPALSSPSHHKPGSVAPPLLQLAASRDKHDPGRRWPAHRLSISSRQSRDGYRPVNWSFLVATPG